MEDIRKAPEHVLSARRFFEYVRSPTHFISPVSFSRSISFIASPSSIHFWITYFAERLPSPPDTRHLHQINSSTGYWYSWRTESRLWRANPTDWWSVLRVSIVRGSLVRSDMIRNSCRCRMDSCTYQQWACNAFSRTGNQQVICWRTSMYVGIVHIFSNVLFIMRVNFPSD